MAELASRIERAYGIRPTIFEHGPAGPGRAIGCTVDHAHLHLVPVQFRLLTAAERYAEFPFAGQRIDGLSALTDLHGAGMDYVYIRDPSGAELVHAPANGPCQYLRRVIARELGAEDRFDWRQHRGVDNIAMTLALWF